MEFSGGYLHLPIGIIVIALSVKIVNAVLVVVVVVGVVVVGVVIDMVVNIVVVMKKTGITITTRGIYTE